MKTETRLMVLDYCTSRKEQSEKLQILLKKYFTCMEGDPSSSDDVGIILFDNENVIPQLCDYMATIIESFNEKIIAVGFLKRNLLSFEYWQLARAGASEIMTYQNSKEIVAKIKAKISRWQTIDKLLSSAVVQQKLIGNSNTWCKVIKQIIEVASYTDAPILIQGESGTGKELIAHLIHELDPRIAKKLPVLLDCTTIVSELSGSEFFGHVKGSFTNAHQQREGAFALANRGTLFLDEIGELPLPLQAELLRVVQEGKYKPVGSNEWKDTSFRLICATNRKLEEEVEKGSFRQDLYYRIATWVFTLPPLRDRREDIPLLVEHFLRQFLDRQEVPEIESSVMHFLVTRDYPGNIRELRQLVRRIACRYVGTGPISIGDIPIEDQLDLPEFQHWDSRGMEWLIQKALASGITLKEIKRLTGNLAMNLAIEHESGNLQLAARRLGVSDRTLQMFMASKDALKDRRKGTPFTR